MPAFDPGFTAGCQPFLPPGVAPGDLPVRRLGRTPELCDRLTGYVLAGTKTGVFSQPEDFPAGQLPRAGDLVVLADFADRPRCLLRYDECAQLRFDDVTEAHLAIETPALRDLAAWRKFHRGYWEPVLAARGIAYSGDLPIVYQKFSVLFPRPAA
ncbi:MAG: ASCH domain-containing protein [Gammaproteobacteria bacterium]|nr:ASCH domain-containing protein [Gammaproteobacteria bacterium]